MKAIWSLSLFFLSLTFMASTATAEGVNEQPKQVNPEVQFQDQQEFVARELIVKFKSEATSEERAAILNEVNSEEKSQLLDGDFSVVKVPSGADLKTIAKTLLKNKLVALVEPNYRFTQSYLPKEPKYQQQWYLNKIQAPKAWDKTKGSSAITVAVIDDGVQQDHPELKGKIISPYNAVTGTTKYSPHLHATHVAGIIAASFNRKGIAGIAPNVKIMPINVFTGDEATTDSVVRALQYAVDHHADIINMSLGAPGYNYAIDSAVKYARSKGVVLIAAAGNEGSYQPEYPAACDGVLAISATTQGDKIASWSNRGSYIDLAAPGDRIYSAITGGSYGYESGTSMATPVVSGVAALVRSRNPFLSSGQVETILKKSTVDLGTKGRDSLYGYGRIDANKAVSNTALPVSTISVPKIFTAKGTNKAAISFTTAGTGKISLSVKSSKGTTLRRVVTDKSTSGSKFTLYWDGKTDSKKVVSSGTYKVEVKMTNGRKTVYKSTTIKVNNQTKADIIVSGTYAFSPKVSGKINIPYELTQKAKIMAVIKDQAGKTVKTILNKKSVSAGKHSIIWDGRNSAGQLVKDGTHSLEMVIIDSHNKAGTAKKVQIKVDTISPEAEFALSPPVFKMDNQTSYIAQLEIKETATVIAYVKNDKGTIIRKLINQQFKPGKIAVSWNGKDDQNTPVPEGNYYVDVQAKDLAGNTTTITGAYFSVEDWRTPEIQASKDVYLKTTGMMNIDYLLSKSGTVTVGIYQGANLMKRIKTDEAEAAGKQTFQWDGTDLEGKQVPDGDYQFKIQVIDKYNLSQTFTGTVHVELTKIDILYPSIVALDLGETPAAEVYYQLSRAGKVTIEILNQRNEKVKTIQKDVPINGGTQSFRWDGKNEDGYYEDDEFYYFVITAESSGGQKFSIKGKMSSTEDPSWLKSHEVSFNAVSDYSFYHDKMNLKIQTSQQVTLTLYVYDDTYGTARLDLKSYTLKPGENTITYQKPSTDYLYYQLKYQDALGNQYWYDIDEWEYF